MKIAGHIARLALAATPPGALFLAQSWLVATGQTDSILSLAKYAGLLGLIFFAFDGSSGLIPAMLRLRHSDAVMRSAYLVYRAGIAALGLAMIPIALHVAPADTATLLPFLVMALLLRFSLLDADLDRRGFQHWAMLLQNGWMPPLCLGAVLNCGVSAEMAGHAALWSTVVLAMAHVILAGPAQKSTQAKVRPALFEIVTIIGAQGIGQLYGRAALFVLGASFSGPLPALIIYAKQVFNAAGLLVTYLRRVELTRHQASMGLSLTGQAAIALVSSILIALAAPMLGLPHGFVLMLIAWQSLEKLSSTAVYDFQLQNRHRLALAGLCNTCVLGLAGLALALGQTAPILFVTLETLGYCVVLLLWFATNRSRRAAGRAARP